MNRSLDLSHDELVDIAVALQLRMGALRLGYCPNGSWTNDERRAEHRRLGALYGRIIGSNEGGEHG